MRLAPIALLLAVAWPVAGFAQTSSDLLERLAKAAYVVEGAANPKTIVYAFSDPNCPYCSLMWRALQPYEEVGLQVRWVQVAELSTTSAGKAAALLLSPDGGLAMKANEERFDYGTGEGAIVPVAVPASVKEALKRNQALMRELRLVGTPAMVYQEDGKLKIKAGMPAPSALGRMLNLPEQPVTDPVLVRFH